MADYNIKGYKYGTSVSAGSAGGILTWALDASVPDIFTSVITASFNDWTSKANIQFQQVSSAVTSTIKFTMSSVDGLNSVLATGGSSYYQSSNPIKQAVRGTVNFDIDEKWHISGSSVVSDSGINLFNVALHEIGHVLGLDHYNASPSIMNSNVDRSLTDLTQSDIDGIQYLYGPSKVVGAWTSLVDQKYYTAQYADVAASGIDPATHYNSDGWREGRNPDKYFFSTGYLAANSDVSRAGVNPLAHYDQSGWKEGRDPSANFDNELYLSHNPDVARTGIDPLAHYFTSGQAEGRQAYAAVGKAADLSTHSGFDSEYYLLSNADVAKAAIAAGGDSFAFAYNHYEANGWHEGRNPNAVFDVRGYLAAYTDIAAANIDPLAHYEANGWKEG
ncbi:matrixin family metalloprotease, partial [Methylobacterium cerastii]|uniref:matrixin family metalloprotease n=1 Tax=Methylobacterium cerastii TaxID=932741 RepID=UPI001EE1CA33